MVVLLAILRAIPALRGLADRVEELVRRANAQGRREEKLDYIDSAIADAVAHPSERVRDEETELLEGSDRDPS